MAPDTSSFSDEEVAVLERFGADLLDQADPGVGSDERNAWVTCLTELGYLSFLEADGVKRWIEDGGQTPPVVELAIATFRRESPARVGDSADHCSLGEEGVDESRCDPVDLAVLTRFTSFDGELTSLAEGLPPEGRRNLYSRSLHYRLQTLGVFNFRVDTTVGHDTWAAIDRLKRFVPELGQQEVACRLLCDFGELVAAAAAARDSLPVVYVTCGDMSADERRMDFKLRTRKWRYDFRRDTIARSKAVDWYGTPSNRFILHVLKILLWTYGFNDEAGSAATARSWRPDDAEGLYEAIRYHRINLDDGRIIARVGRSNGQNVFAVDIAELIDAVIEPFNTMDAEDASVEEVFQSIAIEDDATETELHSDGGGFLKRIRNGVKKALRLTGGFLKRVYHGVRNVLRSAAHAVVSLVRDGPKKLWDFVRDRAGPVTNVVRTWIGRIRDGARVFSKAIKRLVHFVLRRPVVHRGAEPGTTVVTFFDLDADTIRIVEPNVPTEIVATHGRHCLDLARESRLLLTIAIKVLKSIPSLVAGPGVGWLRFAFKVGTIVRDIIGDWDLLRRLATNTNAAFPEQSTLRRYPMLGSCTWDDRYRKLC
jgi:hypothetical protein